MTQGWLEQSNIKVSNPSELLCSFMIVAAERVSEMLGGMARAVEGSDLRTYTDCRVMFCVWHTHTDNQAYFVRMLLSVPARTLTSLASCNCP